MINRLNTETRKYGMNVNASKIKVMQIWKQPIEKSLKINLENEELMEQVEGIWYLGVMVTDDGRAEIRN